jgi:hypothetical protein
MGIPLFCGLVSSEKSLTDIALFIGFKKILNVSFDSTDKPLYCIVKYCVMKIKFDII